MAELPRLTAAQATARLGIKQATLYAYVSRGLLGRERTAAGSTFDPLEVEAFARARRRDPAADPAETRRTATRAGSPLMVLDTDIAEIADDELFYRGRPVVELLDRPLADVAAWLWHGPGDAVEAGALPLDAAGIAAARAVVAALPREATLLDRIQAAVTGLAAADPLRYDATADGLRRAGALILAGVPRALSPIDAPPETGVAELLWPALTAEAPTAAGIRALDAALVLLIDHDLAVSTLSARVAASARASGYAVITAALGALDSPLHGNASRAAAAVLAEIVDGAEPNRALAAAVRDSGGVPGFGQPLYSGTDARAAALFPLIAELDRAAPVLKAVDALTAEVSSRAVHLCPNVDLALGTLALAAGMRRDAGTAVFAMGRLVGWIAHALAEYEQRPMRLRPRGRYVGAQL